MSQLFGLSRRYHHFLFINQNWTKKWLPITQEQHYLLSRCVQTKGKRNLIKESQEESKSNRECINLKGLYKSDTTVDEDISKLKYHDADTFGTMSPKFRTEIEIESMPEEADDEVSMDFINSKGEVREHNLQYAKRIANLIEENRIGEALDVLDVEMKAVGARPANYIYTLLIGACSRIGNTQKAFNLYTQMRKRSLKVTSATYTALLNACATCRESKFALQKIDFLRDKMNKAQYEMNEVNYNALIKVFGRHKALSAAFTVVDEMIEKKVKPSLTTFNFLLQACISDKQAGFRHALMTWHKLRLKRVLPDEFSYNLLLRACRECGLGNEDATRLVIDALISPENRSILELVEKQQTGKGSLQHNSPTASHDQGSEVQRTQSSSSEKSEVAHTARSKVGSENSEEFTETEEGNVVYTRSSNDEKSSESNDTLSFEDSIQADMPDLIFGSYSDASRSNGSVVENRPNLISREPHLGDIISIGEVKSPQDRLLLLGGVSGVLAEMSEDLVPPSVKTFTLLLDCIPNTLDAEQALLAAMRDQRVEEDTEFCNMLIKRRVFRGDVGSARNVLNMFKENLLQPDLITYGCLALGCQTHEDCEVFLEDLNESGYRLNKEMLGAMLHQACHRCDIHYAEKVMSLFQDHEIPVDQKALQRVAAFVRKGYSVQKARDQGQPLSSVGNLPGIVEAPWWRGEFFRFARAYRKWLADVKIEQETSYEHQFRKKADV